MVVAVDPKDGDKNGDSPANVDDGEEEPGELGSDSIQFNLILSFLTSSSLSAQSERSYNLRN